jgi:hypothetical protein
VGFMKSERDEELYRRMNISVRRRSPVISHKTFTFSYHKFILERLVLTTTCWHIGFYSERVIIISHMTTYVALACYKYHVSRAEMM